MLNNLAKQNWFEALTSSLFLTFLAWPHATTSPQLSWVWGDFAAPGRGGWARGGHGVSTTAVLLLGDEGWEGEKCEVGIGVLLQGHSPACPQPVTPASPGFPLHCQSQPQSLGRGSQPGRHRLSISPYLWCVQPPCPTPQHFFLLLFAQGEAVLVAYSNSLLRLWSTHSGSDLGVVMHSLSLWEMTLYLISFPQRTCDSSCVTSRESTEHFAVSITNRAFHFRRTEV